MKYPKPGPGIFERLDVVSSLVDLVALWAKGEDRCTRSYRMCGRILRLRCDNADYAHRFEQAFCRLRCDDATPNDLVSELTFLTREVGLDGCPALIDLRNRRLRVFEHEEVLPTQLFFCLAFLEKRMFPLPDHLMLHGSALEHRGMVTAIVGRTYSGKSTLGLRLALEPELAFLSDEFCPIRLADGLVEPFPRCLGLRGHARQFLAARGALSAKVAESLDRQIEVDPGSVRGLRIGRGGPIRNIVLLSGEGGATLNGELRLLDLPMVTPSLLADLQAVSGVRAVHVLGTPVGFGATVRIEVEKGVRVSEELIHVCRDVHKMEFFGFLPPGACRPDFTKPPMLSPEPAMRGIIETVRSLANHGALESHLGGSFPKLLDCLAVRLGNVRFFTLRPGPLEETSRLLQSAVLET